MSIGAVVCDTTTGARDGYCGHWSAGARPTADSELDLALLALRRWLARQRGTAQERDVVVEAANLLSAVVRG